MTLKKPRRAKQKGNTWASAQSMTPVRWPVCTSMSRFVSLRSPWARESGYDGLYNIGSWVRTFANVLEKREGSSFDSRSRSWLCWRYSAVVCSVDSVWRWIHDSAKKLAWRLSGYIVHGEFSLPFCRPTLQKILPC